MDKQIYGSTDGGADCHLSNHRKQFHNDGFNYWQKYLPDAILFACSDLPSDVSYYTVDLYNRNKRPKDVLIGE